MEAILAGGAVEAAAVADPSAECVAAAQALTPDAQVVGGLDEMLGLGLDGVVIATPSALHAAQSIQALEAGAAVFCQKPLGRTAAEVEQVVAAARARIGCWRSTCRTGTRKAWSASRSWCAAGRWGGCMRSI
jgi:predicted dehydrogenase